MVKLKADKQAKEVNEITGVEDQWSMNPNGQISKVLKRANERAQPVKTKST